MKLAIAIALALIAGIFVFSFSQNKPQNFSRVSLASTEYEQAGQEIAQQINDLSPTPPTTEIFAIKELEFVKNQPFVYVVYHDTRNAFRVLLETLKSTGSDRKYYRVVAAFEAEGQRWKLTGGQDLAKGKETVKINPN
ncbi:MAG: hypothetical protein A3C85_02310 [Candidatus Doudnabacteria bacterium RIFCSPHIGHO2_02_FULL_48_21]|uniref:Uncharacterized protein n=1 Tax=Candidatus Doudnabacteria bacterium RIFCSPLOWO2_02_FULL_48_13 TaxID=1817845 RepID=A0A1F5QBA0_9BACT|nr:MAG: hypothetical protein A3K05_04510 [Candidatus Doudnabacteria bacterium RIFCSPHIGHO2_01_48_18]OGE79954.1 MAG: hypothetical protein A2668_01970 [Candidatus Doudnabacteria bacterium RIFCSPHIGHO2_01_FULL_48_180]OGE90971.1 MAG: hypothetical protein A3F44_02645 [Candidatus Doudnabacteria bacterium RIFCSPHIGHO2_12_FULL_47_25]OGE93456.1 MAG: hypothetical protein A3C85_02310 [Candidatus Doudnabacteria bacterium RIFCSPHIGHO2_02_FULL_48_21]OGE96291.1 MAG: hypothetical protein A3A83_04710 [Candidatu